MAMTKTTWSINGLSTELGMDRRTLSKRLCDLPPAEEKKQRGKTVKRWHLQDVLAHLNRPTNRSAGLEAELMTWFKETAASALYHNILASNAWGAIIVNGAMDEVKISRPDAMRVLQLAGVALAAGMCEALDDDTLKFAVPEWVPELGELGPEAYLQKHPVAAA